MSDENVELDFAEITVTSYLSYAVKAIDSQFGDGYAKDNPDLVASYIAACSHENTTLATNRFNQHISSEAVEGLRRMLQGTINIKNK